MDSPNIVDIGLTQMLTLVVDRNSTAELDVFIFSSFVGLLRSCVY